MTIKKQGKRHTRIKRPPVFQTHPELGALALRKGFPTIQALAEAVGGHYQTVADTLRLEIKAPLLQQRIADALGVSVKKLEQMGQPALQAEDAEQGMHVAATGAGKLAAAA